jgi:hypothetical protein
LTRRFTVVEAEWKESNLGSVLRLDVAEEGAESQYIEDLATHLRDELLELPVADVTPVRKEEFSKGARGVEAATVGALVVSLGSAAEILREVMSAVVAWMGRGSASTTRSVRLELDGDVLELSGATIAEQEQLIGLFIHRHRSKRAEETG